MGIPSIEDVSDKLGADQINGSTGDKLGADQINDSTGDKLGADQINDSSTLLPAPTLPRQSVGCFGIQSAGHSSMSWLGSC